MTRGVGKTAATMARHGRGQWFDTPRPIRSFQFLSVSHFAGRFQAASLSGHSVPFLQAGRSVFPTSHTRTWLVARANPPRQLLRRTQFVPNERLVDRIFASAVGNCGCCRSWTMPLQRPKIPPYPIATDGNTFFKVNVLRAFSEDELGLPDDCEHSIVLREYLQGQLSG